MQSPNQPAPQHHHTRTMSSEGTFRHNPYDLVNCSVYESASDSVDWCEEVVVVEFKRHRCEEFHVCSETRMLDTGRHVIVETERGFDLGRIVSRSTAPTSAASAVALRPATREEVALWSGAMVAWERQAVADAQEVCRRMYGCMGVEVQAAELQFDRRKVTICYTAPEGVDVGAALTAQLYKTFLKRVVLQRVDGGGFHGHPYRRASSSLSTGLSQHQHTLSSQLDFTAPLPCA
eukprot:TRINITY_DN6640_c0_g1_i7.p1 TRINITY_DN6640_c0_g1~~TRINITY_DN6640_c0_g1_i7.p1  ORF type:complete len:234 (+),score=84.27 TRINITY_DN6640_c0_g1_i7:59-760(+)